MKLFVCFQILTNKKSIKLTNNLRDFKDIFNCLINILWEMDYVVLLL